MTYENTEYRFLRDSSDFCTLSDGRDDVDVRSRGHHDTHFRLPLQLEATHTRVVRARTTHARTAQIQSLLGMLFCAVFGNGTFLDLDVLYE